MNERLRRRVEELFENAPKTRRVNDLKEELLANLNDKYNDLITAGKSEDEAYNIVINGIGDVDELLRGLKYNDVFNYEKLERDRKRFALNLTISIALYIMSVVLLIFLTAALGVDGTISVCLMLTMDAVATCIIIYSAVSRPKYVKADDTMVEDFKEWKSTTMGKNRMLQSVKSILWPLIIALYFILSFMSHRWDLTWIIFIIGVAVERIIVLIFQIKEQRNG